MMQKQFNLNSFEIVSIETEDGQHQIVKKSPDGNIIEYYDSLNDDFNMESHLEDRFNGIKPHIDMVSLNPDKTINSFYVLFDISKYELFQNEISHLIIDDMFNVSSSLYIKYDLLLNVARLYYMNNPTEENRIAFLSAIDGRLQKNVSEFIFNLINPDEEAIYIYGEKENYPCLYICKENW